MATDPNSQRDHRVPIKAAWIGTLGMIIAALISISPQLIDRLPAASGVSQLSGRSSTVSNGAVEQPTPARTAPSIETRPIKAPSIEPPSTTALSTTSPSTFSTARIESLEQLKGQPRWMSSQRRFVANSQWRFNPDGTFEFSSPDLRADLYPLVGRYELLGDSITFQAEYLVRYSPMSTAWARMQGKVDLARHIVTANWFAGAGATARMKEIPSNGGALSGYRFTVRVKREVP